MKSQTIVAFILFTALLVGCKSDPPNKPVSDPAITGIVKDVSGNPVAGAYLNFKFQFQSLSHLVERPGVPPTTVIQYQVPGRRFVRVTIEDYAHVFVRKLVEDTLNGGVYNSVWDGRNSEGKAIYSDCFYVRLLIGDSLKVMRIFLVVDQHLESNPAPYAQTDQTGRFSIPLTRLPLTEVIRTTNASGQIIDSMKIANRQPLFAFTATQYGVDTVLTTDLKEHTIVLSIPK